MTEFIDTHSHLYDEAFDEDIDEVLDRCRKSGIRKIVLPGIDIATHERMMKFYEKNKDFAYVAAGLHPTSVNAGWKAEVDFVASEIEKGFYKGVGEIGLDLYWSKEFEQEQKDALSAQFEIAASHDLPVIIHCREAAGPMLDLLKAHRSLGLRGTMHAYSGSYESYREILRLGDFKFGIGGVLTYKKASIAETVKRMDLNDLILETDCPWLTPVPFRGKRNESSYIPYIAAKLAELRGCTIEEIAETTTANAEQLFRIR